MNFLRLNIFLILISSSLLACQSSKSSIDDSNLRKLESTDYGHNQIDEVSNKKCKQHKFQGAQIQNPNGYQGPQSFGFHTKENSLIEISFWGESSYCINDIEQIEYYGLFDTEFSYINESQFALVQGDTLFNVGVDNQNQKICVNNSCEASTELIADNTVKIELTFFKNYKYTKIFLTDTRKNVPVYNPYGKDKK